MMFGVGFILLNIGGGVCVLSESVCVPVPRLPLNSVRNRHP